jgi:hypothetical protein
MPGGQVGAVCGEKTGDFSMVAEEFRAINRLRGGSLPVNHRLIWGYGVFIFPTTRPTCTGNGRFRLDLAWDLRRRQGVSRKGDYLTNIRGLIR